MIVVKKMALALFVALGSAVLLTIIYIFLKLAFLAGMAGVG